ncbi:DUF294 nucleotidyltransferase-like domain-containing protein [Aquimarina sp. ERC-38]|uniref:DUF294 nucleotidyltransferase-like domain-containing protein n=1 Tax=Aquimarina sp. ERC-38 TaxID=2949996 RepID=UPI002246F263|nr:DUF294 nucleotidyltransferase-like domain-containing protein [Aquimarina sp. ERC-38]UZO81636.1 DUF294 nucleotidyltransferase-like domain-containing protein [Aquimarina sp. ERC-38]
MKNTIAERILDFLKNYPPFKELDRETLLQVSSEVVVKFVEKDSYVFKQDDPCHDAFYIVREGAIGLYRENSNKSIQLIDICDTGDLFGLRIMIIKKNYRMSAKADQESIVYAIPSSIFSPLIQQNEQINTFVLQTFASHARNSFTNTEKGKKIKHSIDLEIARDVSTLRSIRYRKNPLTCKSENTVAEAAQLMTKKNSNYIIIVNASKYPLGIVTDSDLRLKIATGTYPVDTKIAEVMTTPVKTYPKKLTVAQAQIALIKNHISHLCLTKNGSRESKLVSVLSEHDILVSLGNNPTVLIKDIKKITKVQRLRYIRKQVKRLLKTYLEQQIPTLHILNIITEVNDALVQRTVELAIDEMPEQPPVSFAFLVLGSQGRKEQLLITDQDNALLFEDVLPEKYPEVQGYFLQLSAIITKNLHTVGFKYCEAEMMASNPNWCLSASQWSEQFTSWMATPNEETTLLSAIFFDFRVVYGNEKLADNLSNVVFTGVDKSKRFLALLGKSALQKPSPLGFFKQFLVEQNGEHKDSFDIKTRAMMVLIDAARILALEHHLIGINSTLERYDRLAELEENNSDLFESCSKAFRVLLKFRTRQGLQYNDSGRYINLKTLSKGDKLKLKQCFRPIREIQELLTVRYQLKILM